MSFQSFTREGHICPWAYILWKALEDVKTDTKSAITWYKNCKMQANTTLFYYMHNSKDTDTDLQCEGINIKSEYMVKMLDINIDKKN